MGQIAGFTDDITGSTMRYVRDMPEKDVGEEICRICRVRDKGWLSRGKLHRRIIYQHYRIEWFMIELYKENPNHRFFDLFPEEILAHLKKMREDYLVKITTACTQRKKVEDAVEDAVEDSATSK